jgi:hypothetical protein
MTSNCRNSASGTACDEPTDRELEVAAEIISRLENDDAGTWSLYPDRQTPEEGFLVSAPLMGLTFHGVPRLGNVLAWLRLNRDELSNRNPERWRAPIREIYSSQGGLLLAGAWHEPNGPTWLDVNVHYPNTDLARALVNGRNWGQDSIRFLDLKCNIQIPLEIETL